MPSREDLANPAKGEKYYLMKSEIQPNEIQFILELNVFAYNCGV